MDGGSDRSVEEASESEQYTCEGEVFDTSTSDMAKRNTTCDDFVYTAYDQDYHTETRMRYMAQTYCTGSSNVYCNVKEYTVHQVTYIPTDAFHL